jgi:uncharacterized membrane protein
LAPRREPRSVPASHALDWYSEAIRLWKRGPITFAALALIVLVVSFATDFVPAVGVVLSQLIVPLAGCGLQYASLAADRGDRPRLVHAIAVFSAPPLAMASVILADLIAFAAQAICARILAGVDLLEPAAVQSDDLTIATRFAIYTVGLVASLPFTFVPFAALFDLSGMRSAFAQSIEAFYRNPGAMLIYGALALTLLLLGLVTSGIGLIFVLPWVVAAAYAAWKDIFAVPTATPAT